MYDVELLEKEWKKYKIKQTLPWIGFIFIISLMVVYILNREFIFNKIKKFFPKDNNISTKIVKVDSRPTVIVKDIKVPERCIEVNKTKEVKEVVKVKHIEKIKEEIAPDIVDVNDAEYNEEIDKEIDKENSKENDNIEDNKSNPKMSIEFAEEEAKEEKIEKPHKRKYLNIIVTDKDSLNDENSKIFDTLSIVEDRYNESNNYRDALYLADGYYEKGDYEISQKWALLSNSLNSNSEDSWLIFAKSKAKLGDYKVAEDILEAYLKENSSKKAEELLKKIQLGKF